MNDKAIEARLERSLRNQVKAPRLEKRFDAAVWSRIDAGKTVQPVSAPAASNWLFVMNGIGIGVAFVLLCVFGLQSFSGIEANVSLPEMPLAPATMKQVGQIAAQAIAAAALVFGLSFTPWVKPLMRRLRAEFS